MVACSSRGFVVEVERAVIAMATEEDEDVEPVEGINEADSDVHVVLEAIAVVDIEVEELVAHERPGKGCTRSGAPHELVQVLGIQADHVGVLQQAGVDEGEHSIGGRQQDFGLGLERLRFHAMLQRGPVVLLGQFDVGIAGGVETVGVPFQRLGLLDSSLYKIAERSGPVDGELGSEFVSNVNRILQALGRVCAYLGGFSGGTGGPDGVVECLRCHHRALEAVVVERFLNPFNDGPLLIAKELIGGNNIRVVSGPIRDADFPIGFDGTFDADIVTGGGMEQGMTGIGRGPLGSGDVITASDFGRIRAAAGVHQALDKGLLLICGYRCHMDSESVSYPTGGTLAGLVRLWNSCQPMFPTALRTAPRRRLFTLVMVLALAACDSSRQGPPTIGEAYVGPATLNVRQELAPHSPIAATVKHGDKLEVVQTKRRFVRVRTANGALGWTDSRQLLSTAQMDDLNLLSKSAATLPSQGSASVFETLNVHTEASRVSPSFAQIAEGTSVDVIGHRLAPKVAPPAAPIATVAPKAIAKKSSKKDKKGLPPPPMPSPPPLPPNWLELSRSATPEPGAEAEFARESEPKLSAAEKKEDPVAAEVPMDDWSLVRLKDGRAGWVLFRMLVMSIPTEVAQYAEGHRITSYFALSDVDDEGQKKHDWLWTTIGKGAEPWEFDGLRVFVWNLRRHRYETAYKERNLKGFYPVTAVRGTGTRGAGGTFSVILQEGDAFIKKTYRYYGMRVSVVGTEPIEGPKAASPGALATAAPPSSKPAAPAEPGFFERLKERTKSVFKK